MSIENFFNEHPAEDNFTESVSWPGSERKSPIKFMSNILASEGRKGLERIGPRFFEAQAKEDRIEIQRTMGTYLKNSSAVYLAAGLWSIEEMLAHGTFDPTELNARIRMFYAGTYLDPHLISNPQIEQLTREHEREIARAAVYDKTFASFFRDRFSLLPDAMRDFYNSREPYLGGRIISTMNNLVLPDYEKRARILIAKNGRGHS